MRVRKLTKPTADAFIVPTRANIRATKPLLSTISVYVLSGVFADEALEKFFGQYRQRSSGHFYIDAADIKAAVEAKNLHTLLKYDSTPHQSDGLACSSKICFDDDLLDIADTKDLITSNDNIKHKIVFLAGYFEHKFRFSLCVVEFADEYDNEFVAAFLENLNQGGLTIPKLLTVHFVYSA